MTSAQTSARADAPVPVTDALVFTVGDEHHAIVLRSVREVVTAAEVAPVPGSPGWLLGMVNLRGDVVPVVDSGQALSASTTAPPTHLIVADTTTGRVAVAATGTPRRAGLGERAAAGDGAGSHGSYLVDGGAVVLLDLDGLTAQR